MMLKNSSQEIPSSLRLFLIMNWGKGLSRGIIIGRIKLERTYTKWSPLDLFREQPTNNRNCWNCLLVTFCFLGIREVHRLKIVWNNDWRLPAWFHFLPTQFTKYYIKCAHFYKFFNKNFNNFRETSLGFLVGRSAGRKIKSWAISHIGLAFFKYRDW